MSQLSQQVMTTVTQVANDYWELVYARQNVKVEQTAVAADQQLYDNNKKQLEIGTMAPLDVLTAESQLATDQQGLGAGSIRAVAGRNHATGGHHQEFARSVFGGS